MPRTVKLAEFLALINVSGLDVSAVVADIAHDTTVEGFDLSGIDVLDEGTFVGILHGFRYARSSLVQDAMITLGERALSRLSTNNPLFSEFAHAIATCGPFDEERSGMVIRLLDKVVKQNPALASKCRATALQIYCDWSDLQTCRNAFPELLKSLPWGEIVETEDCGTVPYSETSFKVCQISDIHFGRFHAFDLESVG